MFTNNNPVLEIPEFHMTLFSGSKVKLGRFESTVWLVSYGWYSWGGNRPVCGWYLTNMSNPTDIKPLQKPDLDDIYLVEM